MKNIYEVTYLEYNEKANDWFFDCIMNLTKEDAETIAQKLNAISEKYSAVEVINEDEEYANMPD